METHDCFETTEPKPLNMVDINDDCKEFIFEYLDLADLVNIAETRKQLNSFRRSVCASSFPIRKQTIQCESFFLNLESIRGTIRVRNVLAIDTSWLKVH